MSDENRQELAPLSAAAEERIDPATVAELHAQYGAELQRFLLGLLRDHHLAGDVFQTTFVRLAQYGHKTRAESRKGWLFRVAYNEAMLVRRRQAIDDVARRRTAWEREPVGQSAEAALVRAETVQLVRQAIRELPAEQQRVVRMRIYEDKTFAAIAVELGIPLGTALGRMRTALIKLRSKLEKLP